MAKKRWATAAFILIFLAVSAYILSGIMSLFVGEEIERGNVLVIPVKGMIVTESSENLLGDTSNTGSTKMLELLDEAEKDESIEAIVFDINSGGGSAVGSYEIMQRIKKMNKTTVSVIREIGASGAYWIASSTDHIISSPLSFVGSIGVISSYLEFSGLLKDYNITYQRLVSGKYKDTGTPFKELTEEERNLLMEQMEEVDRFFFDSVISNRNISDPSSMEEIETAKLFLGRRALEIKLVDQLGDFDTAEDFLETRLGKEVTLKRYQPQKSLMDILRVYSQKNFYFMGQGIGSTLEQKTRSPLMT